MNKRPKSYPTGSKHSISTHHDYHHPNSYHMDVHPTQGLDLPVIGRPVDVFRAFVESCEIQAQVPQLSANQHVTSLLSFPLWALDPVLLPNPSQQFSKTSREDPGLYLYLCLCLCSSPPHLPPLFWPRNVSPACQQQWEVT